MAITNPDFNDRSSILGKGGRPIPSGRVDLTRVGAGYNRTLGDVGTLLPPSKDWRVRITLPPQSSFSYRSSAFAGLPAELEGDGYGSDGVVFPYIPTMTVTHNARYTEQALTHSNFKNYFYEGSDVGAISLSGVFTCQNDNEARYLMGCLQFLRACTKMRFGDDPDAGQPPTLVRLQGYGDDYLAGSLSCIVTQVSHTMPDDVDYIKYERVNTSGWMPTSSTLTVALQPIVSRRSQSREMDLDKFARGDYVVKQTSRDGTRGGII
jgi:hypothetical protein